MSTPPGQEPRPGFTPRADQGRPGGRGDSGRPDPGYRRDDSGPRQPPPGASRRGAGGDAHDSDFDDDYWAGGRQPGPRAPRGRDPRDQPARRPDDGYRRDRGWGDARDGRDPRGGYRDGHGDATIAAGRGGGAPTFVTRNGPATAAAGQPPSGSATSRTPRKLPTDEAGTPGRPESGPFTKPGLRWIGSWRGGRAALVLLCIALVGLVATIVVGRDPGFLIGVALIVGALVAAVGARRRSVHTLIPLPAMSYLVVATVAGIAKDYSNLKNTNEFATSFLTWIGGGFFGLVVATVLVVLITFVRWLGSKLLVSGQIPAAASASGRTGSAQSGRDGWTGRPPRGNGAARADRGPRDRGPSGNAFGESRAARARQDGAPPGDRVPRTERGPRDGAERGPRDGRDRGPRDGRERGPRDGRDGWGASGEDDLSGPRPSRDARGQRDGRPRDDVRRPRPADGGPRDLW